MTGKLRETGMCELRARAAAAYSGLTHLMSRRLERVRRLRLVDHLAAQVLGLALHEPRVKQPRELAQLRPVTAIGRLQRRAGSAEGRHRFDWSQTVRARSSLAISPRE